MIACCSDYYFWSLRCFFLLQVTRTFQYVCKSWGQIANNCLRHCFPGSSMGKIVTQLLEHLCAPNIKWSPIDSPPTLHNTWRAYRSLYILIFWNLHKGKCRKYIIGALQPPSLNQIPAAMSIEEISWKISVFYRLKVEVWQALKKGIMKPGSPPAHCFWLP